MDSSTIEIELHSGGKLPAYFAKARGSAPAPTVVILQEIFGVNANIRAIADGFAKPNFNAIAPELYWRQQRGVQLDPTKPADVEAAMELMKGMDQESAVQDALAAGDYARRLEGANGKLGAVGFCIGGKIAYLLATRPGVDAAVSYYGIAIYGALDKASEVQCPLLLHIPEADHLCPPEAQAEIKQALGSRKGVKIMTYPRVDHAFARCGGDAFDESATERADNATEFLFADTLAVGNKTALQKARIEVAQGSRILAGESILDAFGHVSRRHPDRPDRFLIPRDMAPALVTPADVVELDLEGTAVSDKDAKLFLERFIHAEIYRSRPDVQAVVHSHAPEVLPFAAVPSVRVQVISHMCGFLQGVPSTFDLADHSGPASDLLIRNGDQGRALAEHLGEAAVVLMRGHGFSTVGGSVPDAVFHAIYTALNCHVQPQAMQLGRPLYLSEGEAQTANASIMPESFRAWDLWCHLHAPDELLVV